VRAPIGNIGDDDVGETRCHRLLLVPGKGVDEEGGGGEGAEEGEGEGKGGGELTHGRGLTEEEGCGGSSLVEKGLFVLLPSLLGGGGGREGEGGEEGGEVGAEEPGVTCGRVVDVLLGRAADGADGVGRQRDQVLEEEGGVAVPFVPPSLPPSGGSSLLSSLLPSLCQSRETVRGCVTTK